MTNSYMCEYLVINGIVAKSRSKDTVVRCAKGEHFLTFVRNMGQYCWRTLTSDLTFVPDPLWLGPIKTFRLFDKGP